MADLSIGTILPVVMVAGSAVTVLVADLFVPAARKGLLAWVAAAGLVVSMAVAVGQWLRVDEGIRVHREQVRMGFADMVAMDQYALFFVLLFCTVGVLAILLSDAYLAARSSARGEFYVLLLLVVAGMIGMAISTDTIALFISFELMSLPTYVMAGWMRRDPKSGEASLKYFLNGAFSSAILLFGLALLYGLTGATNYAAIAEGLGRLSGTNAAAMVALVLVIAGMGFKVSAVPFHAWAPDVYEGAPSTITSLLAAGSKKMGFVAMFKFFLLAMVAIKADWEIVVGILAIITMTIGNLAALNQTNIKRMLAYSSIAQAGYILIAIAVGTEYAVTGGIFHILTHAFMKGGAFIVVATLATVAIGERIADYKGLAKRSNFMAFSMTVLLFSLAGIPPLAGFASKVVLFSSPIQGGVSGADWMIWLAVAGIINSAISLYYYARVVKYMYVDELDEGASAEKLKLPRSMAAAVAICVVAVIAIGVYPELFVDFCREAATALFA